MTKYIRKFTDYELRGLTIETNYLRKIDVVMIPHYGWLPCFNLIFDYYRPISPHNNISNLGFILHTFCQIFDMREDGVELSKFVDIPVRLLIDESRRCVGIGHDWKDQFILFEDLMKVNGENYD